MPRIHHASPRGSGGRAGPEMTGAKYVCSPPPPPATRRASGDLGTASARASSTFSLSDHCPLPLREQRRQAQPQGAHVLPLGAQRHSGHRDAPADPVLGGGLKGADRPRALRRAHRDEPREDLRPLPGQGRDRDRLRRRHRAVGPEPEGDDHPGHPPPRGGLYALGGVRGHRLAGDDDRPAATW